MKIIYRLLSAVIFLAFISCAEAANNENSISGEVVFAVDYKPSVMEQKGYHFIGQGTYGNYSTNYFGVHDVDVTVKNGKGEIIGVCKTKADGTFALSLEPSKFYQFSVEYLGRKIEKIIPSSDAIKKIQLDIGRFDSDVFNQ